MVSRRALLAFPLLGFLPPPASAADAATVSLGGILVPASRARLLANVRLGGEMVTVLAFAADLPEGERDLFVVAVPGRVAALDLLTWHGADGTRLHTRVSAVSDGVRLRLQRIASAPRGRGYRREEWIDYLAWQNTAPMLDAPVRPVLAGTWQAAQAAQRIATLALLAGASLTGNLNTVSPALLAACPPPKLPV